MRKSKLAAADIEAAEMADNDRKNNRKNGFSMMDIRDRGWARLNNGMVMVWPTDCELAEGEARHSVPEGHFIIKTSKEELLFGTDEFQRYLRWV